MAVARIKISRACFSHFRVLGSVLFTRASEVKVYFSGATKTYTSDQKRVYKMTRVGIFRQLHTRVETDKYVLPFCNSMTNDSSGGILATFQYYQALFRYFQLVLLAVRE